MTMRFIEKFSASFALGANDHFSFEVGSFVVL